MKMIIIKNELRSVIAAVATETKDGYDILGVYVASKWRKLSGVLTKQASFYASEKS